MILERKSQCTGAVMEISESLRWFIEDSVARVRLNRSGGDTYCSLFLSLWKVIFLIWWVLNTLCRTFCLFWVVVASNGLSPGRAQEHVLSTRLGHDRGVV